MQDISRGIENPLLRFEDEELRGCLFAVQHAEVLEQRNLFDSTHEIRFEREEHLREEQALHAERCDQYD